MSQGTRATVDFISQEDVLQLLQANPDGVTVKHIGTALGLDMTDQTNIKNISNRCGYLLQKGRVARIAPGTYQERKPMETIITQNGDVTASDALICPECGFEAKSQMGLRAHHTRAHHTRAHKKGPSPDEMFERIGLACEVLWPDGIPMSRVIEIAELQKAILKVLSR